MTYHFYWHSICGAIVTLASLCQAVPVQAQAVSPNSRQVRDLIDQAGGLAVEYRADLQLGAAESKGALLPTKIKVNMLQGIFEDADSAVHPYKEKDVSRNNQTLSKRMEWVYPLNLDGLSIKTRVIKAMLDVDGGRARDLLTQVSIEPPHTPCSSPFVYDVSEFYPVVLEVMRRAYTPEEISRSGQLGALEKQIRDAQSPMQLVPLAHVLATVNVDSDQLNHLSALYAEVLGGVIASDRELGYLLRYGGLNDAIKELVYRNRAQPAVVNQLLESYRHFLVQSAAGPACSDISTDRTQAADGFNQLAYEFNFGSSKLTVAALQPHGSAGAMQVQEIPDGEKITQGVLGRLVAYRTSQEVYGAPQNSAALVGLRSDTEELLERINAIDTRNEGCEACLFQEKAELYFALWQFAPDSETSRKTLEQLVIFMEGDHMQAQDPIEWLQRFQLLLNLSRAPTHEQEQTIDKLKHKGRLLLFLPGRDASTIRPLLAQQHNALIQVYLHAETVLAPEYVMPPY